MKSISISIGTQKLYLLDGQEVAAEYDVSTAANGIGFEEGSYCTPTGRFEISELIGDGEPQGTIFEARKAVGVWTGEPSEKDLVLTRVIRLHGLDPQNANTLERYIYIHGTNQEKKIGTPASCGCIRMRNAEMVELFERVEVGDLVQIGV